MMPIRTGTQVFALWRRSCRYRIRFLIMNSISAAISPPITGEITQLAAIFAIVGQLITARPAAAAPPPMTPPTMEWVVETGALSAVARLIHRAAARRAHTIRSRKDSTLKDSSGLMIPFATVLTTSPPASSAPALSHTTAIVRAAPIERTPPPTAGPMLFATSLAPMLSAM